MSIHGKDDLIEEYRFHAQLLVEKGYVSQQSIDDLAEKLYELKKRKNERYSKNIENK